MKKQQMEPVKVLTIAGSDSGGAAGLQADLRAWALLEVYGLSVLTAVTSQNSVSVEKVQFMSPEFVADQLDAVLSDYGATAVKTGFIGQTDLIITISAKLQLYQCQNIVIDPVLVNHRGQPMFPDSVRLHYLSYLLPLATLLTPNIAETAVLLNTAVPHSDDLPHLKQLAQALHRLGPKNVYLKGGRAGAEMVDIFFDGQQMQELRTPRIETKNTHGSGDVLSAAVCATLASGDDMATAVAFAHHFTQRAIQHSADWQLGNGHGPVYPVIGNQCSVIGNR